MSQPPLPPRRPNAKPHNVTLRLNDIHDLFTPPRHNAFNDNYLPLSGIDQIALQLKLVHARGSVHTTFILPAQANQEPNLHAEIQAAIQRYCNIRLEYFMIELKSRQSNVIRSIEVGVIILGISLALAATISHAERIVEWLRMLLSNSISIFGSVALWSPADAFLFGIRPLYNDIHVCQAICQMTFDIQYEQSGSTPITTALPAYPRGIR
jgi:hypothetical protein